MERDTAAVRASGNEVDRRNARVYLLGLAASLIGSSAMTLVAGIWVKALTGSSSLAGAVAVCLYAPALLSPAVGVWVDRVRRRPLLMAVNVASALAMVPLLTVRADEHVWIVFAVMLVHGLSLVVTDPAENALFSIMLPRDLRARVNGMRLALQEGGKLVAPLLGAGLFAVAGGGAVAAVDAATFVLAAVAIGRLRVDEPPPVRSTRRWRDEVAAGFAHLRSVPELWATTIAAAIAMVVAGIATPAQYSLVEALHRPPSFLGVITAALGGGSIVACLVSPRAIRRIGERRLVAYGLANGVVGYVLYATGWLPTVLLGALVLGFALPWTVVALTNLVQRATPVDLQGRVFGAVTLALFGLQPAAQAVGAAAIAVVDHRTVYLTVAVAALATSRWLLRRPACVA